MRKVTLGGEAATGKRRVLVAIGALLILAIAGGVAWQQAWIGAPLSCDSSLAYFGLPVNVIDRLPVFAIC